MIDNIFGKRLKELRRKRKLSQLGFSNRFNVGYNTISQWETGKREPGLDIIVSIARYFNISLDYLLGLSDDATPIYR